MVLDRLTNRKFYEKEHPLFAKAFEFLENFVREPLPVGRYEIAGEDVYAIVQAYETKPEGLLEAHDEYIDIQFMAAGRERIEYADRQGLEILQPYEKDILFLADSDAQSDLVLAENSFAIFYPHDAHKPCLQVHSARKVLKVVVKIKV